MAVMRFIILNNSWLPPLGSFLFWFSWSHSPLLFAPSFAASLSLFSSSSLPGHVILGDMIIIFYLHRFSHKIKCEMSTNVQQSQQMKRRKWNIYLLRTIVKTMMPEKIQDRFRSLHDHDQLSQKQLLNCWQMENSLRIASRAWSARLQLQRLLKSQDNFFSIKWARARGNGPVFILCRRRLFDWASAWCSSSLLLWCIFRSASPQPARSILRKYGSRFEILRTWIPKDKRKDHFFWDRKSVV